ncbi:hypothetical protein Hamer_G000869, partial [Homarus americanus]
MQCRIMKIEEMHITDFWVDNCNKAYEVGRTGLVEAELKAAYAMDLQAPKAPKVLGALLNKWIKTMNSRGLHDKVDL